MDISWEDLKLFLAVVEAKSLSAAAKRLSLGQPTVSRRLADLEYQLGYKLFERTVSGVTPTAAAVRLIEPAKKMAEWAGEVGRAAAARDRTPQGIVRITAAPGVAFDFVAPFATHVKAKLPKVQLEVISKIEYLDLARGEADLALRPKPALPGSDLVNVAELDVQAHVYVSKGLAKTLPKKPQLKDLPWLAWCPPYDEVSPNPQLRALIPDFQPVFTTDNFLIMIQAAEAGLGAVILGRPPHRFTMPTQLVPLDVSLGPAGSGRIYLVCAKTALAVPRIRAVADLMVDELQRLKAVSGMKPRHGW
ncbi:MAG: LysR family transcriptional regulator [Myxococcaceae bacterium]|nr:LysR family transcriptional regulator [Myxococcaceae bacterium]